MATGFGYEDGQFNLISTQKGYPSRREVGIHTCYVDGCVLYNNCTQAYEALPADCSCTFEVTAWMGSLTSIGCQ